MNKDKSNHLQQEQTPSTARAARAARAAVGPGSRPACGRCRSLPARALPPPKPAAPPPLQGATHSSPNPTHQDRPHESREAPLLIVPLPQKNAGRARAIHPPPPPPHPAVFGRTGVKAHWPRRWRLAKERMAVTIRQR